MRANLTACFPSQAQRRNRKPLAVLALVLSFAVSPTGPLLAQVPGAQDLRALVYYLEHDDQRSVQAEMRRLRAQFPGWTPPTDLNQLLAVVQPTTASADVAGIWARIERADYSGARALIDQTRASVPGWSPDAEMLRVLEMNESQQAFDAAVARRDHAAAIAAARRSPALMRCDRINNAWQLAEMYQAAGQTDSAVATYRGVLGSCTRINEVAPTLEKANDIASLEQLTTLFQTARSTAPANARALDELEARLRAGRGVSAPATATARPSVATTATPSALPSPSAPAPQAQSMAPAAPSVPALSSPSSLALRGDARLPRVRALKEAGDWPACLAHSAEPRSIELLYERAWCAYNLDRAGEALAGFSTVAATGNALGGDVGRDARFGMILSYLSFDMTEEAARIAAATNLTQSQRVDVESIILDQRGVRAYHQREYEQSVAYFDALEAMSGTLRRDLAMLRAYAHMNQGNLAQAREQFTRLHNQLATPETRSALQSLAGMTSG